MAWVMATCTSRSQFDPGKTMMAAFIAAWPFLYANLVPRRPS
jgi:hypothetical protein